MTTEKSAQVLAAIQAGTARFGLRIRAEYASSQARQALTTQEDVWRAEAHLAEMLVSDTIFQMIEEAIACGQPYLLLPEKWQGSALLELMTAHPVFVSLSLTSPPHISGHRILISW
jgi:hypothetical protein